MSPMTLAFPSAPGISSLAAHPIPAFCETRLLPAARHPLLRVHPITTSAARLDADLLLAAPFRNPLHPLALLWMPTRAPTQLRPSPPPPSSRNTGPLPATSDVKMKRARVSRDGWGEGPEVRCAMSRCGTPILSVVRARGYRSQRRRRSMCRTFAILPFECGGTPDSPRPRSSIQPLFVPGLRTHRSFGIFLIVSRCALPAPPPSVHAVTTSADRQALSVLPLASPQFGIDSRSHLHPWLPSPIFSVDTGTGRSALSVEGGRGRWRGGLAGGTTQDAVVLDLDVLESRASRGRFRGGQDFRAVKWESVSSNHLAPPGHFDDVTPALCLCFPAFPMYIPTAYTSTVADSQSPPIA
ncbi:hypothetical protein MVEN_01409800 [Mycena venus]|uniref:Uncharacterized protein n=1 Tax=Mycena venus TaxID=2733690 RepID=A0A8H7CUW5_9AGAR|nr:hypothetical protein MVEN_01409800 [Mycena venus]